MSILYTLFGIGKMTTGVVKDKKQDKEIKEMFEKCDNRLEKGKKIRHAMQRAKLETEYQLQSRTSIKILNALEDCFDMFLIESTNWKNYKQHTIPELLSMIDNDVDKKLIMNYYNNHLLEYEKFVKSK